MMLSIALTILLLASPAWSATISWDCNPESDMKEYRLEYSNNAGDSWGVVGLVAHPKPCTSPVKQIDGRFLAIGEKLYRLFAIDTAGNSSAPSQPVSYTVNPSPIGNPGGQTEVPLPPSPYKPVQPPPPPPPVVPTPPPITRPGKLPGFEVSEIGTTSATVSFPLPDGTKADIRLSIETIAWGGATSLSCSATGTCRLEGLLPNHVYALQGIYYYGTMNQGAIYGDLSDVVTFTTAPFVPPPPPVEPPPPPVVTLQQALTDGVDRCIAKKLSHLNCMKALREALGKVTP